MSKCGSDPKKSKTNLPPIQWGGWPGTTRTRPQPASSQRPLTISTAGHTSTHLRPVLSRLHQHVPRMSVAPMQHQAAVGGAGAADHGDVGAERLEKYHAVRADLRGVEYRAGKCGRGESVWGKVGGGCDPHPHRTSLPAMYCPGISIGSTLPPLLNPPLSKTSDRPRHSYSRRRVDGMWSSSSA